MNSDELVAILGLFSLLAVLAAFTHYHRYKEKKRYNNMIQVVESSAHAAMPIGDHIMKYGRDLTSMAKASKLDPIIGRDKQVEKVLQIFSRRAKNNPILVGHQGVGKTAIIHSLAQKIVAGDVSENFKKYRIAVVDANRLVSGAKELCVFEQRIRNIIDDIENPVILFIEEFHVLLQTGRTESSGGNVLKPYLADGTFHCVGAMTTANYNKLVENDASLSQHFQQVHIDEPTMDESIEMLKSHRPRLEAYHHVTLSDEALSYSCAYSSRFMSDSYLPGKAIHLLDMAAAKVSLKNDTQPDSMKHLIKEIAVIESEILMLNKDTHNHEMVAKHEKELKLKLEEFEIVNQRWTDSRSQKESRKSLRKQIEDAQRDLIIAESSNNLPMMVELKYTITSLETLLNTPIESDKKYDLKRSEGEEKEKEDIRISVVTGEDIAMAVSSLTGIPIASLMDAESERVLDLEKNLMSKIIGQDEAIQSISNAIRISRAGLHTYGRPLGSFLFLGPTGVGKTQLCRVLAQELYNDANAMIRIDMSEYMEKFSVSRLIGAPPGYVGYEEGGMLTEAVRRSPSSLVLFDEFEKAHREVSNLLLQLLDAGQLTDSRGRRVDFCNTMVIMTSNLGSEILSNLPEGQDSSEAREQVMEIVKNNFSPEFLNRIDEIVVFNRLSRSNIDLIHITKMLSNKNITLTLSAEARTWIADKGYDRIYGARPLKRVLQRWLLKPLASLLLSGEIAKGCNVLVDVKQNQLHVTKNQR